MVTVRSITAGYGSHTALRDVDFKVDEGEFMGILGPNGSGKSTLLRVISGVLKPWNGEVLISGKKVFEIKRKEVAKLLAVVLQESHVAFDFTVSEVVLMGRNPYLRRFQMEGEEDLRVARESMEVTDTLHLMERSIHELSAGERQRAVIARALAQKPRILLLDEPTAHLDIHHQIEILDLLKRLNREGLTILMVSHDLNLASEYCERIIFLKEGKLIASGSSTEIFQPSLIEEVYQIKPLVEKNPITGRPMVIPIRRVKS